MSIYNLTEYSKNYEKTLGGLWSYYKHDVSDADLTAAGSESLNIKQVL